MYLILDTELSTVLRKEHRLDVKLLEYHTDNNRNILKLYLIAEFNSDSIELYTKNGNHLYSFITDIFHNYTPDNVIYFRYDGNILSLVSDTLTLAERVVSERFQKLILKEILY